MHATPQEHAALWESTTAERAERMRRLHCVERDVLILHNRDQVIDLREQFYARRASRRA